MPLSLSMVSSARLVHRTLLSALAGWSLAATPAALAGPPLVVDDPETLERGQFELFTSFQFTKNRSLRTWETPVELTIGLAPGWECSINGSWQYLQDSNASPTIVNGVLSLEIGTKIRLLTESASMPVSLAVSGKLRFPTSSDAKYANQGRPSGGGLLVLSRTIGSFSVNANIGHGIGGAQNREKVADAWFFGLAAQRVFAKKYTAFVEAYASPEVARFRNAVINADGGLLWDLSARYRVCILAGRGLRPGGADVYANLGFLLSLGPSKATN